MESGVWGVLVLCACLGSSLPTATATDTAAFGRWLHAGAPVAKHGPLKLDLEKLPQLGEAAKSSTCQDQYDSCPSLKSKYGCDACCLKGKSVAQACPDTCDPCAPKWTAQISQLEQRSKDQQAKIEQLKQQNTNNGDSSALKEQVVTQMESLGGEIKQSVDAGVSEMKALASADELKAVQTQLVAAQKDLIVAEEAKVKLT